MTQRITPDLTEARRLFERGMKMCRLEALTKQPFGKNWNGKPILLFNDTATGYGLLLPANRLCSIDPDNAPLARRMLDALGFDLDELMGAGVRTNSTRPGSGGRSTFRDPGGLRWLKFSFKEVGTVLELRASSANLQDAIPGLVYLDGQGVERTQQYANGKRLDDAPELPPALLAWWRRLSTDIDFLREQHRLAAQALGLTAQLAVSTGDGQLAFKSPHRVAYNAARDVETLLLDHGYAQGVNGRYSPPTATGQAGVRPIPGKDDLWQSDHASDPLFGTFDAWTACVVLEHDGDLAAAEAAYRPAYEAELAQDFDQIEAPPPERKRFDVVPAANFASVAPPPWIVRDILPQAELAVVYGESGSGKSFLVLDMVGAVARGTPWQGRRTRRGRVVYVAAEAAGGFRKRLNAYAIHHGITLDDLPLGVIGDAPNLLRDDDKALADAVQATGGASVIVIDTLAQTTPGANENSGEDMGKVLAHCKRLHKATGALVLLVHHSGKDAAKGARGWSGLRAAVDAEIEITRNASARQMKVTKQKDGDDAGIVVPFCLRVIELGVDDETDLITSCAVDYENALPVAPKRRALGEYQLYVFDVLCDLVGIDNRPVPLDDLIKAVVERRDKPIKASTRRQHAKDRIPNMAKGEHPILVIDGEMVRRGDSAPLHQTVPSDDLV